MMRPPPRSTRTDTRLPYTTRYRSGKDVGGNERGLDKTPRRQKQQRRSRSPDRDIPAMIVGQGLGPRLPAWTGKGRGAATRGDPAARAETEDENRNDAQRHRSDESRGGQESVSTCRDREELGYYNKN